MPHEHDEHDDLESPVDPDHPKSPAFPVKTDAPEPNMIATTHRHALPERRESITHKFAIMGHEGYLTIGLFENGEPGEIFIKMSKAGSTLGGLVQAYCRAFSLALQFGLPLHEAVSRFKGMRFEPMGHTSNPDIPEALSIVDYVARYIEWHFIRDEQDR